VAFRPKLGVVKKSAPSISDPILKRVIDTVYKDINELSDSVNLPSGTHTFLPRDGAPGDIRLYEGSGSDGTTGYFIQGRFSDGWGTARLTLETINPENQEVATDTTGTTGAFITAAGVTKYNLGNNGDVGTSSGQVAQGDHNHNHDNLLNIDPDEHRPPSTSVTSTTLSKVVGAADFWSRGDHVHDIDLAIAPIWTSKHTFGKVELYTTAGPEQGFIKMATTSDLIIDTTRLRITDPKIEIGYGTTANTQIDLGGIELEAADTSAFVNAEKPSVRFKQANSAWYINQKLGVNTADPVRFLGIQDSVNPQLRLINDSTHYVDLQADSTSPIGNLLINPGHTASSNVILGVQNAVPPTYGTTLKLNGAQSQVKGWQIDYLGGADFRYLYTDELHAKAFIADLEQALAGGQIIAKSVATLYSDWTITTPGSTSNGSSQPHLVVNDLPSAEGMRVFAEDDWVRVRQFARGTTNYQTETQYKFDQLDHNNFPDYDTDADHNPYRGKFALGDISCRGKTIQTWTSGLTQDMTEVAVIAMYYVDADYLDKSDHILDLKEGAIIKLTATGSAFGQYGLDDSPYYFQVTKVPTTAHDIHGSGSNRIYQIECDFLPGMSNDANQNWPTSATNYGVTLDLGDGDSGELLIADAWGKVQHVSSSSANKSQTWKFIRPASPNGGYAHGVVKADSIVLDYGIPGNGYHEVNAIDGANASNSPYSQVVTWESGTNQITNSEFNDSTVDAYWNIWNADGAAAVLSWKETGGFSGPRYANVDINGTNLGDSAGDIQFFQDGGLSITSGVEYQVQFAAKWAASGMATRDTRTLKVGVLKHSSPYTNYGLYEDVVIDESWKIYKLNFTATATISNDVRVSFYMGAGTDSTPNQDGDMSFDFISFYQNTGPGTANAKTVRTRTGQLKGLFGQDEFGLYAGSGTTNADKFFRISDKHFDIHNINLTMHSGSATTIKLDSEVPYLGIGSTVTDGTWSTGDKGFLVRYDATEGAKVYVGQENGHYMRWGHTAGKLEIAGVIHMADLTNATDFARMDSGYFKVYKNIAEVAKFGADVRIGKYLYGNSRIDIDSSGNLALITRTSSDGGITNTDTTHLGLSSAGVLTVAGAPSINGSNVTTINGSNITTGTIQSTNFGANDGTQLKLSDGDIKIGGSSNPSFFYDNSADTLTLTGLLDGANIDAGVLKAGLCLRYPSQGFGNMGTYGTTKLVFSDGAHDFTQTLPTTAYMDLSNQVSYGARVFAIAACHTRGTGGTFTSLGFDYSRDGGSNWSSWGTQINGGQNVTSEYTASLTHDHNHSLMPFIFVMEEQVIYPYTTGSNAWKYRIRVGADSGGSNFDYIKMACVVMNMP
tara:strand:+ start:2308 stop:6345 length:4038 start_codon:yes stop_codon:yes gene_type:complete